MPQALPTVATSVSNAQQDAMKRGLGTEFSDEEGQCFERRGKPRRGICIE
jgi:hypothetical protein